MMCPVTHGIIDGVRKQILSVKSSKVLLLQTDTLFNPFQYISGSSIRNAVLWPQEWRKPGFLCSLRFRCLRKCELCSMLFPWASVRTAFKCPGTRWWLTGYEFTPKPFPRLFPLWVVVFTLPGPHFDEICRNIISFKTHSFISALIILERIFQSAFLVR